MSNACKKEALTIDLQGRTVEVDQFAAGRGWRIRRRNGILGQRLRGTLCHRSFHDRADFQFVDPHVGHAGAAVDIDHQLVDVSILEIDWPFELGLHELLLLRGQLDRPANFEPLPAANLAVGVAADDHRQAILEAGRVRFLGQDHASHELNARMVRFHPKVHRQLVRDRSVGRGIVIIDMAAGLLGVDLNVLRTLALVSHLVGHGVGGFFVGNVGGAFDP